VVDHWPWWSILSDQRHPTEGAVMNRGLIGTIIGILVIIILVIVILQLT
jgi:tetrahydromethanopterin S-methyltransferase subunit F